MGRSDSHTRPARLPPGEALIVHERARYGGFPAFQGFLKATGPAENGSGTEKCIPPGRRSTRVPASDITRALLHEALVMPVPMFQRIYALPMAWKHGLGIGSRPLCLKSFWDSACVCGGIVQDLANCTQLDESAEFLGSPAPRLVGTGENCPLTWPSLV